MHKAFHIPEILDEIFSFSSKQTIKVCARVCRLWFTRSIPLVWNTVRLDDPLKVLSHSANEKTDVQQPKSSLSWDRFFIYSQHVRYLICFWPNDAALMEAIRQRPSEDVLFSKLTILHWTNHESQLDYLLALLSPSLRVLRVQLGVVRKLETIDILYKAIPTRAPGLHVFEQDFKPANGENEDQVDVTPSQVESLVELLPKLISFAIPYYCVTTEKLTILSQLHSLESLTMRHPRCNLRELDAEKLLKRNTRVIDGGEAAEEYLPFHSLQEIEFCDGGHDIETFTMVEAFGHDVQLRKLTHLTYCSHYENQSQVALLMESLHQVCPNLQSIMISKPIGGFSLAFDVDISWEAIKPLLKCPALVELRSNAIMDIELEDIHALANNRSTWKVINLIPSMPFLDYEALISFAENCPELVELGLIFDSESELPDLSTLPKDARFSSLTVLDVKYSDAISTEMDAIAMYLSRGGVAGSVVASRLSEKSDVTVLLLEAGKGRIQDPLIDTPSGGALRFQFGNPDYDWAFQTTAQKNLNGRSMPWSRGKGLGGSSNINQMAWTRPGRVEIDAWEKLGNPNWSYDDLVPYFQKVENFHPPSIDTIKAKALAAEQPWFGTKGPISIAFCEVLTGLDETVRNTFTGLGIPAIKDAPLGEYAGLWNCPSTVDPETLERITAFKGYILPNLSRKNLSVLPEAYVTKLIWQNDSKPNENGEFTAEGVEFIFAGKSFIVHSAKEVLLTAGALKSPQILELSGIGRRDVLEPLAIPVLVDLPGVGENLQDHYCGNAIVYELHPNAAYRTIDLLRDPAEYEKYEELYKKKQHGLLSFTNSDVLLTSLHIISPDADEIIERHVKYLNDRMASMDASSSKGLREQFDLQLERLKYSRSPTVELMTVPVFLDLPSAYHFPSLQIAMMANNTTDKPEPKKTYLSFLSGSVGTWSRGSAHISSIDPLDPPQLDANAFDFPLELDLLTEEFKFARRLRNCEPLKSIIAKEVAPGDQVVTDEQIQERIKNTLRTMWHTSGTLSMLPREKNGVVDPSLKVYGTTNVRVCDISIPPLQAAVHTQCLAYAIAEKAVDIILGHA